MTPDKSAFLSKYGRAIAVAALAALVVLAVMWHGAHGAKKPVRPPLTGVVQEMRNDPGAWGRHEKDASALVQDLQSDNIEAVGLTSSAILVSTRDDHRYFVTDKFATFSSSVLLAPLKDGKASRFQIVWLNDNSVGATSENGWLLALDIFRGLFGMLFPVAVIVGVIYVIRREATGAKLLKTTPTLKFSDVIGAQGAKLALDDITAYLRNPKEFSRLGIRPPCGILMTGSPGVGKTRLAQALAGETGANFIAITGSYFSAKYYGAGIKKAQHLFELARKNAPCIIWIDEADGIGARTHSGEGASENESNRVINQVLAEMDGFHKNAGVVVIAATNHPDSMDEAMRRPGRFDRQIRVMLPDVKDRESLFRFYAKPLKLTNEVIDYGQLARLTTGLSPASIAMIANQAGLIARKAARKVVVADDFREAIRVVRMGDLTGAEHALSGHERIRIARHEAGHAVVASVLEMGILEEVTIVPRGEALGAAFVSKSSDKTLYTERELTHEIMLLLGGRNAELLAFGEASTGAAQDLQVASGIAFDAVSKHGFNQQGDLFSLAALPLGHAGPLLKDAVAQANILLDACNTKTRTLLSTYSAVVDTLEADLLEHETVSGMRVRELIARHKEQLREAA